jgi:beta-phosphoglucomutase-like phosphatase (HAD superfamily)
MDVLVDSEIAEINAKSKLVKKYAEEIDRESAYEILNKKINEAVEQAEDTDVEEKKSNEPSTAEVIGKSVTKVVTSASFIRGVFGILMKLFKK